MANKGTIVGIDGPVGTGKTTVSKELAAELGLPHVDTGAMYRCVALAAHRPGTSVAATIIEIARTIEISFAVGGVVLLDGEDVSTAIRTPEISRLTPHVAGIGAVRRVLVGQQQRIGAAVGCVIEGRDIGTKVFPHTPFKYFLTASAAVRAERRYKELAGGPSEQPMEAVLADVMERDRQDTTRAESPLVCTPSHIIVQSSRLTIAEVVAKIAASVRAGGAKVD